MQRDAVAMIAREVRDYLETVWPVPDDPDAARSTDMCGRSASVLASALEDAIPGDWRITGGAEDVADRMNADDLLPDAQAGGMADSHGLWHDHYWVESVSLALRVDITADQFGHEPVTVCGLDDPRYRANWTLQAIDRHATQWGIEAGAWLAGLRLQGQVPGGPR